MNFHPPGLKSCRFGEVALVRNPYPIVHSPFSTYSTHRGIAPGGICRRQSNRSIISTCLATLNSQWFCSGGNLFAIWLAPLRRRDFFSIKLDGENCLLQANACISERRVSKMFTSQADLKLQLVKSFQEFNNCTVAWNFCGKSTEFILRGILFSTLLAVYY